LHLLCLLAYKRDLLAKIYDLSLWVIARIKLKLRANFMVLVVVVVVVGILTCIVNLN